MMYIFWIITILFICDRMETKLWQLWNKHLCLLSMRMCRIAVKLYCLVVISEDKNFCLHAVWNIYLDNLQIHSCKSWLNKKVDFKISLNQYLSTFRFFLPGVGTQQFQVTNDLYFVNFKLAFNLILCTLNICTPLCTHWKDKSIFALIFGQRFGCIVQVKSKPIIELMGQYNMVG